MNSFHILRVNRSKNVYGPLLKTISILNFITKIVLLLEVKLIFTNDVPRRSACDIFDRLKKAEIVDDIIQRPPYEPLEVQHGNWTVDFGNELPARALNRQPEIRWHAPNGTMYTLLVVGPDVPTREKPGERDWLHWLVGNIPNNDTKNGEIRADYIGIERPMYQIGTHRLIYLLYKHQDNLPIFYFGSVIKKQQTLYKRAYFPLSNWTRMQELIHPEAVNFCYVSVP